MSLIFIESKVVIFHGFCVLHVFLNDPHVFLRAVNAEGVQVGVISPYARQVGDMNRELYVGNLDVEVKSVDGFQGRYKIVC